MVLKDLLRSLLPQWLINTFWHLPQAVLANLWYRFPSRQLKIIGVTGTSGKTTTSHLVYHLLHSAGFKVALVSTISAQIGDQELDTGLHVTNPDPFDLQKLLRLIVNKGYRYLVLEVTSHGLDQHRCWGINFDYGIITNLAHEHLDYHGTLERYHQAKLKLIKYSRVAVLNQGDKNFSKAKPAAQGKKLLTFKSDKDFQQANTQAASVVAQDLGISQKQIRSSFKTFPGVSGRMEIIQTQPFTVVIDFAHKPDALEAALKALSQRKPKRIISVFGSAGLRDTQKRPLMGRIAAQFSQITILTAEDPRTEKVQDINDQIEAGWRQGKTKGKQLYRQPDRQKAINLAIKLARPGDLVALFGKSHEKSMCFGKIEYPWSEHQAVKKALKLKRP